MGFADVFWVRKCTQQDTYKLETRGGNSDLVFTSILSDLITGGQL